MIFKTAPVKRFAPTNFASANFGVTCFGLTRRAASLLLPVALLGCTALLTGCSTEEMVVEPASLEGDTADVSLAGDHDHSHGDHDHADNHADHDHATITLSEVMTDLETQTLEIKAAFEGGIPEDAHDVMHKIGHTIGDLKIGAKNDGYDQASLDSIHTESETLIDAFGSLDESLHGGEEKSYEDIESMVDQAMAKIRDIAKAQSEN